MSKRPDGFPRSAWFRSSREWRRIYPEIVKELNAFHHRVCQLLRQSELDASRYELRREVFPNSD